VRELRIMFQGGFAGKVSNTQPTPQFLFSLHSDVLKECEVLAGGEGNEWVSVSKFYPQDINAYQVQFALQ
jgi:hypothetical protein